MAQVEKIGGSVEIVHLSLQSYTHIPLNDDDYLWNVSAVNLMFQV
ncbi:MULTISPECIES: hypothetical protein [Nitrosopumilus]|nr:MULTISPECIES: hypothetical protein [Nitrosopumilus]